MHLLLTDSLTCPRCGPEFGLILRADAMDDRTVIDGVLGCPNCRDGFPVADGFGDLRTPPRKGEPTGFAGPPAEVDRAETFRIAALMGVLEGPGTLAMVGRPARHAAGIMGIVPGVQVVAVDGDLRDWPETEGVSRIAARPGLPFYSWKLRAVCVDGRLGLTWVAEAARVTAKFGRVVVTDAGEGARDTLESAGLQVLAEEAGTIVAARA